MLVTFDGYGAQILSVSSMAIVVTSPYLGPSTVDVQVKSPLGTSAISQPADQFTFSYSYLVPTVASVSPDFGLVAGGTQVTISGTNLQSQGTYTVYFGNVKATSVTIVNDLEMMATSPASITGSARRGREGGGFAERRVGRHAVRRVHLRRRSQRFRALFQRNAGIRPARHNRGPGDLCGKFHRHHGHIVRQYGDPGCCRRSFRVPRRSAGEWGVLWVFLSPSPAPGTYDVRVETGYGESPATAADQITSTNARRSSRPFPAGPRAPCWAGPP